MSILTNHGKHPLPIKRLLGDLHPVLAERLQKIGCEPLTINEVNTFSRAIICGGWENVAVDDPEIVKCAQVPISKYLDKPFYMYTLINNT